MIHSHMFSAVKASNPLSNIFSSIFFLNYVVLKAYILTLL